ncbi:MAG: hypothetical protein ACOVSW_12460, partial [Candidatus Kapaibacteriota bacterium]
MQEFIVRFIPTALRQDPDVFRRARLLVTTSFSSTFIAGFYALQYLLVMHGVPGGLLLMAASGLLAAVPFMLRGGIGMNALCHILVGSFLFVS